MAADSDGKNRGEQPGAAARNPNITKSSSIDSEVRSEPAYDTRFTGFVGYASHDTAGRGRTEFTSASISAAQNYGTNPIDFRTPEFHRRPACRARFASPIKTAD